MDKIYNNLTIDNLVKTDWINQFRKTQQREIAKGYVKKLTYWFMLRKNTAENKWQKLEWD